MDDIADMRRSALCRYNDTNEDFHWEKGKMYSSNPRSAEKMIKPEWTTPEAQPVSLAAQAAASSALRPQGAGSEWTIWKFSNTSRQIRNMSVYLAKDCAGNRALQHIDYM